MPDGSDDPGEGRPYVDTDLLVGPSDMRAAQDLLTTLGFVPELDQEDMPLWWREHAVGWLRSADGRMVDLHRSISGIGVDDELAWQILWSNVEDLEVAGASVKVLTIPGRAMHLVLHAAHHGRAGYFGRLELERALARTDDAIWREAAALAETLRATAAFSLGLRLVTPGEELARRLDLPRTAPVDVALRGSWMPPAGALSFEQVAGARVGRNGFKSFVPS